MNPDQKHVLTLLQDQAAPHDIRRLSALDESDWRDVIAAADVLGVAPLLLRGVENLQVDVPETVRRRLRSVLEAHTAHNMVMLREFAVLAQALDARGLKFMPFKGVHLCTSLYDNIGERPTWDIDVLVQLARIREVLEAVEARGYRPARPFDLEMEVRNYHHLPVFRKKGAPPLEIHWTLLNPRFQNGLNWEELWERSVPRRVGAADVRVFSPEDLLVYLCAHVAYQHIYIDSLRSLYDVKLLVQRAGESLDWGAIVARSRTWGLAHSVYLTLRLTEDLLGTVLPQQVGAAMRSPGFSERLVQAALTRLFEHSETSPVVSAIWSRRSLVQRVRGLWERIAIPRSVLAGRYRLSPSSWKAPLYYLVRARDLIGAHGGDLISLLVGRRNRRDIALRESELVAYLQWWK